MSKTCPQQWKQGTTYLTTERPLPLLPPKRGKARSKSRTGSQNQRPLRLEARVGRSRRIRRLKWGREGLPHKLPGHRDATSAMGHIEQETA